MAHLADPRRYPGRAIRDPESGHDPLQGLAGGDAVPRCQQTVLELTHRRRRRRCGGGVERIEGDRAARGRSRYSIQNVLQDSTV